MSRPEHLAPPEIYYNNEMAKKYSQSSRIIEIQTEMSQRAIELLMLPEDETCLILDIGCGSGLSGSVLDEEGHHWVGMDISKSMIDVALEREVEGDLIVADMGYGCPFQAGVFDAAISISALQWLCNKDKSSHNPIKRMSLFFSSLYSCLCRGARAVFQFYPENPQQVELLTTQAMKAGFFGGVVVDFPNSSKAKKYFLVLMTTNIAPLPKALGTGHNDPESVTCVKRQNFKTKNKNKKQKPVKHGREWILAKKERRRIQGKETRPDTKYTGRKRSGKF